MSDWLQIHLRCADPAPAEELLSELGALAVTVTDAGDQPLLEPLPGETPQWDESIVTGLFPGDADEAALLRRARSANRAGACTASRLGERIWEREWLRDFGPMQFGRRLWICPHGQDIEAVDAAVVWLDPGLAFGTGTHPTTRLCLEWLDGAVLAGQHVIDYGCGSGVLALAAARLGAARVTATDIDPQALAATRDNAQRNGLASRIAVCGPQELPDEPADIVLANILAGTLIELAEPLCALLKPGGQAILSGVLAEQCAAVSAAFAGRLKIEARISGAWARLDGRRFASCE